MGYHRPDGKVGTANYWLVIPLVFCENRNAEVIKDAVLSELGYQQPSRYQQYTRELISQYQEGAPSNEIIATDQKKFQSGTNTDPVMAFSGIYCLPYHNKVLADRLAEMQP